MTTGALHAGNLVIRWLVGLTAIVAARLLLEQRLPRGSALGIGLAIFMLLWVPTIPSAAWEPKSPLRRLVYVRFAWFVVAVLVAGIGYNLVVRATS